MQPAEPPVLSKMLDVRALGVLRSEPAVGRGLALRGLHDRESGLVGPVLALDRLLQCSAGLSRASCGVLVLHVDLRVPVTPGEARPFLSVAQCIRQLVRPDDTVARWDETAILALCHRVHSLADAVALYGRVVRVLGQALPAAGQALTRRCGVSGAVLWSPLQEEELLGLLVDLGESARSPSPSQFISEFS